MVSTIADILTSVGSVFTLIVDKVASVLNLIPTSPILMLVVGVSVTGAVFGFGGRLLGLGKRI